MKYVDRRDLPPCTFSSQCLRLVDELDLPVVTSTPSQLTYIEDLQDEHQLRSHLSECPTCSALLAEARRLRTRQRLALYHYLVAGEHRVPATTDAIFAALRRVDTSEEAAFVRAAEAYVREQRYTQYSLMEHKHGPSSPAMLPPLPPLPARPSHRRLFQQILTLATVAAVILAAVGLVNRFTAPVNKNTSSLLTQAREPAHAPAPAPTPTPRSPVNNDGWSSVLIGVTVLSASSMVQGLTFYNYDTDQKRMGVLLSSTQTLAAVNTESFSSDGQTLLYDEITPDQQKSYATVSSMASSRTFYQTSASHGGNAVWMDTMHVLVQDNSRGVVEFDARTGSPRQTWTIKASRLTFYHQPFLYFIGPENPAVANPAKPVASALYRANLAQPNPTPQRITDPLPPTRFWLSIDGTTIFYARHTSPAAEGIYAVGSDGTPARLLRPGPGVPIGYASDNALMVLEQAGRALRVIKLGTTPGAPEQVILPDVAPGVTSLCGPSGSTTVIAICDQNIALAPYGYGLLLHAYYANGSSSMVYDDLATGTTRTIFTPPANSVVQMPGWSRIPVPHATALGPAAAVCA